MREVYFYALGANLSFALGSLIFTHYSRKVSSSWMNLVKALVAALCFFFFVSMTSGWHTLGKGQMGIFFLSGMLGLGIGDIFMLRGFSQLGPGRSMMIFGFQPLLLGVLSYFFFNQEVTSRQLVAIIFLILCLLTFSLERYRRNGHWDLNGLIDIIIGVTLDAIGVVLTRTAFEMDPAATSWEGNFYRSIGAVMIMLFIYRIKPFGLIENFKIQSLKGRGAIVLGSFLGTFLSLGFYLKAVQTGHLATISAISITGSLFSSTFECLYEKRWPSIYLVISYGLFLIGTKFLLF